MQKLTVFKAYIKDYFDNYVDKEPNETWNDYWEMLYDCLREENAIVTINKIKYVAEGYEVRR